MTEVNKYPPKHAQRLHLAIVPAGQQVRVTSLQAEPEQAQRLRELGLLEGKVICILLDSDPMICKIGNSRLGLCHRLARNILVEPVHESRSVA